MRAGQSRPHWHNPPLYIAETRSGRHSVRARRKLLLGIGAVVLAASIVVWRPLALGYTMLVAPYLFPPPQGPDTRYAREGVRAELDSNVLLAVRRVYWYEDPGWLDHPRWARFEVGADTGIPSQLIARFHLTASPTPVGMVRPPRWFALPPDSLVRHYSNGDYHLWVSNDGRRVWYHFFDH